MTDEHTIKALECCQTTYGRNCKECPYAQFQKKYITDDTCSSRLRADLLTLINRQKAEIERLKAIGKDEIKYRKAVEKYSVSLAITEFANKVEQKCLEKGIYPACVKRAIEETKREMTEQGKEDGEKP